MKTLKKDGEYIRVPDKLKSDIEKIKRLLESGWNYTSKKDWKDNWRVVKEKTNKKKSKK